MRLHILVPECWEEVAGWIKAACEQGCESTVHDLRLQIEARKEKTLFAVSDEMGILGGGIFELDGDVLHMQSFGAKPGFLVQFPEAVDHWCEMAVRMGCNKISLSGRRAWDRFLPKFGFVKNGQTWELQNVIRSKKR